MVKRTVKFNLITAQEFHDHFALDSPGTIIAKEALAADEVDGAVEIVEVVCLTNKLYAQLLYERMLKAFRPADAEKFLSLGGEEASAYAFETLGTRRCEQLMRQTMVEVRREVKIGQNDKTKSGARPLS